MDSKGEFEATKQLSADEYSETEERHRDSPTPDEMNLLSVVIQGEL